MNRQIERDFDAVEDDNGSCSECDQPVGEGHLGTCSMSVMRSGRWAPVGYKPYEKDSS